MVVQTRLTIHLCRSIAEWIAHGYWPFTIKGSITSMPADFLVDRSGVIRVAYYGRDEGDHLDFEKVKRFATDFDADGRAKKKHD